MVRIEATVPPQALTEITEALKDVGFPGLTVSEVTSDLAIGGRQSYRGTHSIPWRPMVRVEVVVPRRRLEEALGVVTRAAGGVENPEGRVLITPIAGAVRIRTGETGEDALGG